MRSAWSDDEARAAVATYTARYGVACNEDLALRTYSARLIGREPTLVLHGGGNTSVKTKLPDDTGALASVICVKGSGWDLADIEPPGHPAVRLDSLLALRDLDALDDEAMVNAARVRLLDARAPNPSVELLLHAFLPHAFVDHSHADAILALLDQEHAQALCRELFGERLALVPYVMPGFALAKLAARVHEQHPHVEGLLLHQHGLFTFAATARESYERHIAAVTTAEMHIVSRPARLRATPRQTAVEYGELAPVLRGRLGAGQRHYVLHLRQSEAIGAFVDDPALASLAGRGPATPDHVLRTKRLPLVLDLDGDDARLVPALERALADYRAEYTAYFERSVRAKQVRRTRLDPDPRIVLVPGLGLIAAGVTENAARIAADVYEHTIAVIRSAEAVGRYRALPEGDIFDMEYWSLEQAKLGKSRARALESRVVLVTGAARGIGEAVARRFAREGAHLFLWDTASEVLDLGHELGAGVQVLDVTDREAVERGIGRVIERFGGLDGVVSNAGVAPQARMDSCPPERLRESMEINVFAHQWVASAATRVMRAQGMGGFLLFNVSKAAFDPGPGFGPYAVAKAALLALCKQYALEGADAGIRANAVNPDRVRTGLLSPDEIERRARARGLDADAYFRSNLLRREVTVADVAEAFLALALAESTTGAVFPVDGGNLAAAPR